MGLPRSSEQEPVSLPLVRREGPDGQRDSAAAAAAEPRARKAALILALAFLLVGKVLLE